EEILKMGEVAMLEVGPSQVLSQLLWQISTDAGVYSSLKTEHDKLDDRNFWLTTVGRLWLDGVEIKWPELHHGEPCRRIPLPTYPFERQRYWVDRQAADKKGATNAGPIQKSNDIAQWFYAPSWQRRSQVAGHWKRKLEGETKRWLLFVDEGGIGAVVAER